MILARFRCRGITPIFIGNAEPNDVEIRPASITGLMRFWWRAMNARLAAKSLQKLQEAEEKIFGGVLSGGRRSSFNCWIEDVDGDIKDAGRLLGAHNFNIYNGGGYLFYILINQNKDQKGYAPGLEFELVFTSESEKYFRQAIASFWLAVNLGGFGTRSRRGGGAIQSELAELEGIDNLGIDFNITYVNDHEKGTRNDHENGTTVKVKKSVL
ncbi:MAG: type III-B CRISPR module RAMP protein Cmr1, partial [Bacteroidota bacterium]